MTSNPPASMMTVTTRPVTGQASTSAITPADQALAAVVGLLLADGYGFTIPAWDGDAYLRTSNALSALTSLTMTQRGDVTWEYRSTHGIHVDPAQVACRGLGRQPTA
jgi:hypothetical protein